jgi:hypothetical protein
MKVGTVGAFEADAEAAVDRLDQSADLDRLRCSSQEAEHSALTVSERTCPRKPIEALLKRRRFWRGLAGDADRGDAPCLPSRRLYRRFNLRSSSR